MADHAELLERVKAATGPDREIDAHLYCLMEGWEFKKMIWSADLRPSGKVPVAFRTSAGDKAIYEPPKFTASLDAALALVERVLDTGFIDIEVAKRFVGGEPYGRAEICGPDVSSYAQAATPPLALLAALLSALAAQDSVGEDQLKT